MKTGCRLVLLLIMMHTGVANAQPFIDLFQLRAYGSPNYGLFRQQNFENRFIQYYTNANIPIKIPERKMLIMVSPYFEDWNMYSEQNGRNNFAKGLGLPIMVTKEMNTKWSFTGTVVARLHGKSFDLPGVFQLGGNVLMTRTVNERLKYRFGVYYNREAFGNFFLPLLGIVYKPNSKWYLWGTLPANLLLQYNWRPRIKLGSGFRSLTNTYQLGNDQFIQLNDIHLGMYIDWYLTKNICLNTDMGHSVFRQVRFGESGELKKYEPVEPYNDNLNFRVSLLYRIQL
jgi:hypothetical protein